MIRMPEGINGERFFQKHWSQAKPDYVESITVFSEHRTSGTTTWSLTTCRRSSGSARSALWSFMSGIRATRLERTRRAQTEDFSSSIEALESSVLNFPDYLVLRHRPIHLLGQGSEGAEPELNKKGFAMGRRVAFWLRELLPRDDTRCGGQDFRQDRPSRVRSDRAHGELR